MKLAGFLLALAGWLLALAALVLLKSLPSMTAFVLAGIAVEVLGIVFVARAHLGPRRTKGDA